MGAISNRLVERLPVVGRLNIDESLARAVRPRNFFAHEYFRQRTVALLFHDGQKQISTSLTPLPLSSRKSVGM